MYDIKTRTKQEIQQSFPNLKSSEFNITSRINFCYNCHAWSAGYDELNMQPSTNPMFGWLTGEIGEHLGNFEKQFQRLGFEKTDNYDLEDSFEKVVFYVKNNVVEHTSRQLKNGWWASKLGPYEDIEYKTLNGLEGEEYGQVQMIMKRPVKEWTTISDSEKIAESDFENFKNVVRKLVNVPKQEIDKEMKKSKQSKTKK